jgi:hypothetical protein
MKTKIECLLLAILLLGADHYILRAADLHLLIGSTNGSQAWLALSNTVPGTYYQILKGTALSESPAEFGQIVQASSDYTLFANIPYGDPAQQYFQGVAGSTVVSIIPHPDYNLAVQPATSDGAAQIGKFLISINPPLSHKLSVGYQISGTATNGIDYTNLSCAVTVPAFASSAEIEVGPKYNAAAGPDVSVALNLILTNGYLVNPAAAAAAIKIYPPRPVGLAVAILDSGWTRATRLSATNWDYFTLPEAVKEALRSDGTPYAVFTDLDIMNGALLGTNGLPNYPILISLANEVVRDEEIGPLTNFLAAGGFILGGSSAFTRGTNGAYRTNFALASQMGLNCTPSPANWYYDTYVLKMTNHMLVDHLSSASLIWRLPAYSDEMNWGTCAQSFNFAAPHPIWQSTPTTAIILARGDYCSPSCPRPYLTVNRYGAGWYIYDAAMQPLISHGGNGPGISAYLIFRRAIEWAFQTAGLTVARLSAWPYAYDAAYMVRHDLENYVTEIANVSGSAQYEWGLGAKGDYYFCTGSITNQANFTNLLAGLQNAISNYGATIGSHNGGLPNPNISPLTNSPCHFLVNNYNYFHWGPDEALDRGNGYAYSSNSIAISFAQIDAWLGNYQSASPRVWVAPFFNATRDKCYRMQQQLNVQIAGEQKLVPLPHWTLSTQFDGIRYPLLTEPVSDWFTGNGVAEVAQVVGPWQSHLTGAGVHNTNTLHDAVDCYYTNGFLINFYSHSLSFVTNGDQGGAAALMAEYVAYCANATLHPAIWPANARDIYNWWLSRSSVQVSGGETSSGSNAVVTVAVAGAQDANTSVEVLAPGPGVAIVSHVLTNGITATGGYRINGNLTKVRVGTTVTNVVVYYGQSGGGGGPPATHEP